MLASSTLLTPASLFSPLFSALLGDSPAQEGLAADSLWIAWDLATLVLLPSPHSKLGPRDTNSIKRGDVCTDVFFESSLEKQSKHVFFQSSLQKQSKHAALFAICQAHGSSPRLNGFAQIAQFPGEHVSAKSPPASLSPPHVAPALPTEPQVLPLGASFGDEGGLAA
jgi:hypothetical protein